MGKALSKEDFAHWQFLFWAAPEYTNVWELRFGQCTFRELAQRCYNDPSLSERVQGYFRKYLPVPSLVFLNKSNPDASYLPRRLLLSECKSLAPNVYQAITCMSKIVFTKRGGLVTVVSQGDELLDANHPSFHALGTCDPFGQECSDKELEFWTYLFTEASEYATAWRLHFRFFTALETALKIRAGNYPEKLNSWCERFISENTPALS